MNQDENYTEYLKQLDEIVNNSDFEDTYGFPHDCHCSSDWEEGKVQLCSECYMGMTEDALRTCHEFKGQIAGLERTSDALRIQVRELGGEPRV